MYQPLSYIHPGAKIAKNVVIEPFTSIDKDVVINNTNVGKNLQDHIGLDYLFRTNHTNAMAIEIAI